MLQQITPDQAVMPTITLLDLYPYLPFFLSPLPVFFSLSSQSPSLYPLSHLPFIHSVAFPSSTQLPSLHPLSCLPFIFSITFPSSSQSPSFHPLSCLPFIHSSLSTLSISYCFFSSYLPLLLSPPSYFISPVSSRPFCLSPLCPHLLLLYSDPLCLASFLFPFPSLRPSLLFYSLLPFALPF